MQKNCQILIENKRKKEKNKTKKEKKRKRLNQKLFQWECKLPTI